MVLRHLSTATMSVVKPYNTSCRAICFQSKYAVAPANGLYREPVIGPFSDLGVVYGECCEVGL